MAKPTPRLHRLLRSNAAPAAHAPLVVAPERLAVAPDLVLLARPALTRPRAQRAALRPRRTAKGLVVPAMADAAVVVAVVAAAALVPPRPAQTLPLLPPPRPLPLLPSKLRRCSFQGSLA